MEQLAKIVAEFAGKMGIESARLWPQIVMVYYLKNLMRLVLGLPLIIILGWSAWRFARQAGEATFEEQGIPAIIAISCGVLALFLALPYIVNFAGMVAAVFWPDASMVLDMLGGKSHERSEAVVGSGGRGAGDGRMRGDARRDVLVRDGVKIIYRN